MTHTQHSKGPWEVDQMGVQHAMTGERIFKVCKSGKYGGLIADVSAWWVDTASAEANAHLIASAPDLLRILKHIIVWDDGNLPGDLLQEASEAIAKAEGRE